MAREQKKLSKKELKQDPLMKSISKAQVWLELHGKQLAYGLGAVLVVLLIAYFVVSSDQAADDESMAAIAQLQSEPNILNDTEILSQRLLEISEDYKGTIGGSEALYNLAQLTLGERQYEEALEYFEEYAHTYKNEYMLTTAALAGQATSLENLNRWDEAAVIYERIASNKKAPQARPNALLSAGRCYLKAGQPEKAKGLFEAVVADYDDVAINKSAKRELARLALEG